jgi:hypothetical protein
VVEVHRGRPRVVRRCEGPDDSLAGERVDQPLVAQVTPQQVDHRLLEQHADGLRIVGEPFGELLARRWLTEPHVTVVGWAQRVRHPVEQCQVAREAVDVAG